MGSGKGGAGQGKSQGKGRGKAQKSLKIAEVPGMFAAILAVPFLMVLGNSMIIPVFPKIQSVLGVSRLHVGLLITLFSVPAGIFIPFAGFLSDRVGRKAVIAPSILAYGLGGLIAGTAALLLENPYWTIIGGRVLQGLGAAGMSPVTMALVGDLFTGTQRGTALGVLEASNAFGKVASPILGSIVALLAWWAPFYLYGVLSIPLAAAIWFLVKEPPIAKQAPALGKYYQVLKKVMATRGLALVAAFFAGMVVLYVLFGTLFYLSEFLEKRYHMAGVMKGVGLAAPVAALSLVSFLTGRYLQSMKKRHLLVAGGLVVAAAGLLLIGVIRNTVVFFSAVVVMGLGSGFVLPTLNNLITSSVATEERGIVTAVYGSVRFFGVALGPPLFGMLLKSGRFLPFATSAGVALLAAFASFLWLGGLVGTRSRQAENEQAGKGNGDGGGGGGSGNYE